MRRTKSSNPFVEAMYVAMEGLKPASFGGSDQEAFTVAVVNFKGQYQESMRVQLLEKDFFLLEDAIVLGSAYILSLLDVGAKPETGLTYIARCLESRHFTEAVKIFLDAFELNHNTSNDFLRVAAELITCTHFNNLIMQKVSQSGLGGDYKKRIISLIFLANVASRFEFAAGLIHSYDINPNVEDALGRRALSNVMNAGQRYGGASAYDLFRLSELGVNLAAKINGGRRPQGLFHKAGGYTALQFYILEINEAGVLDYVDGGLQYEFAAIAVLLAVGVDCDDAQLEILKEEKLYIVGALVADERPFTSLIPVDKIKQWLLQALDPSTSLGKLVFASTGFFDCDIDSGNAARIVSCLREKYGVTQHEIDEAHAGHFAIELVDVGVPSV